MKSQQRATLPGLRVQTDLCRLRLQTSEKRCRWLPLATVSREGLENWLPKAAIFLMLNFENRALVFHLSVSSFWIVKFQWIVVDRCSSMNTPKIPILAELIATNVRFQSSKIRGFLSSGEIPPYFTRFRAIDYWSWERQLLCSLAIILSQCDGCQSSNRIIGVIANVLCCSSRFHNQTIEKKDASLEKEF